MCSSDLQWFAAREFVEVECAALQRSPGNETHLHGFATELIGPDGGRARRYLHTSPEFAMKKLLAAGEPKIFQFARTYRNGERSATHHPEFTMLEWYRTHAGWRDTAEDCRAFTIAALNAVPEEQRAKAGFAWDGRVCDPTGSWEYLSVSDAFACYAAIDLPGCLGVIGWNYRDDGMAAGKLAVRVLKGESPSTMAFEPLTKTDLLVSQATAKAIGVSLPAALVKRANQVVN